MAVVAVLVAAAAIQALFIAVNDLPSVWHGDEAGVATVGAFSTSTTKAFQAMSAGVSGVDVDYPISEDPDFTFSTNTLTLGPGPTVSWSDCASYGPPPDNWCIDPATITVHTRDGRKIVVKR